MGECLMPRRGGGNSNSGGNVKTGWATPTSATTIEHDDFIGAKRVVILSNYVWNANTVIHGSFEPGDYDNWSFNSVVFYMDDYGGLSWFDGDPGLDLDAVTGVLHSDISFETTLAYDYIAIY